MPALFTDNLIEAIFREMSLDSPVVKLILSVQPSAVHCQQQPKTFYPDLPMLKNIILHFAIFCYCRREGYYNSLAS